MRRHAAAARSLARLPRADRRLIVEAALALLDARLRCTLLPFRTLAQRLGGLVPPYDPPTAAVPLSPDVAQAISDIRWSIRSVAPCMPFRALCLQQAIAARTMLRCRGIDSTLHLGVGDPTGAKLEAHAWLDVGGREVTGYPVDPALAEVGRFV